MLARAATLSSVERDASFPWGKCSRSAHQSRRGRDTIQIALSSTETFAHPITTTQDYRKSSVAVEHAIHQHRFRLILIRVATFRLFNPDRHPLRPDKETTTTAPHIGIFILRLCRLIPAWFRRSRSLNRSYHLARKSESPSQRIRLNIAPFGRP